MITLLRYHNGSDKALAKFIHNIFGFYPKNISLFQLAFTHKSIANKTLSGLTISNERLEYLGDAILSAIVAEFLFKKFPTKQEGFLTEMRSRIVSRSSLNKLSQKFGFEKMINYVKPNDCHSKMRSIGGNAFEAFTGALFLDRGYDFTYKVLVDRVIRLHVDIENLEKTITISKAVFLNGHKKKNTMLTSDNLVVKATDMINCMSFKYLSMKKNLAPHQIILLKALSNLLPKNMAYYESSK